MKYLELENAAEARKHTFGVTLVRTSGAIMALLTIGCILWVGDGFLASWADMSTPQAFATLGLLIFAAVLMVGATGFLFRFAARMERQEADLAPLEGRPLEQLLQRERQRAEILRKFTPTWIIAALLSVGIAAFDGATGEGINYLHITTAIFLPASYFWMRYWSKQRRRALEAVAQRTSRPG
ncbi:MAG: hypothetical protein AAFZ18_28830 [Myxococcota bacterium]